MKCSTCHELDRATDLRLARADWREIVKEMQANAGEADLTDEDCDVIVDYLAATRGT